MSEFNKLGLFGQVPEDFKDDPKISNISFTANDPNNPDDPAYGGSKKR